MNSQSLSRVYKEFYFAHNCGRPYQRDEEWMNFFGSVADRIVRDIGPATALDAGCAMGFLVESLRARGVDAVGLDISEYAIEKAHPDVQPFCRVGSVTEELPRKYDLIVCIEVLEHLPPAEVDQAIENFCRHTDDILFSSTPFDYKEATHLNVRPPDYWAQRFAQHGFFRDHDFDASFLTAWAARFRKTGDPAWRIVYGYERHLWQLQKEVQARRELTIEQLNLITEKEQRVRALTEEIAAHQQTVASLTADLESERERARRLVEPDDERLQAAAKLSEQLAEQQQKLDALLAPVVAGQSSLASSLARLLESREALEGLASQLAEREKTISALHEQAAERGQESEALRAELRAQQGRARELESQLAEAGAAVEEGERKISALAAEAADRERAIRTLKSRERGAEMTIEALSRAQAEQQQALERQRVEHEQAREQWAALLASKDAQLADVNSSLVWYLYNRIKYPYLIALFRLYERIKYPYLLWLYRRLGLVPGKAPEAQAPETATPQVAGAEAPASLPPKTTFPIAEVSPPPALPPHEASVDIIVCVHNAPEDVRLCLESVIRHTRMPYSLILVDDGSDDETRTYLASFADSQGALLIRNEKARGYTFAANQGLRRSRAQYALLLNSDTVVTPLWLDRMVACGESDPQVGLVGPLSNVASWQSIPELSQDGDWAENKLPEGLGAADMGRLVAEQSARLYPRIPFLNGFCLMIKRGVIEQLGYFDEEVFGQGYGEENDYCLRARKAGWQLCVADDAYVYHSQSRSYSHERRKELCKHADAALAAKHEPQMIHDGVGRCQSDPVLQGIRARSRTIFERRQLIEAGMGRWEGKRVTFILPITSACGGGNVVVDEAEAMRRMGVDARILNLSRHREVFERSYPRSTVPVMYAEDERRIADFLVDCDAAVATANNTVYLLETPPGAARQPVKAYYVQDFEPYFFEPERPSFRIAWNSYTEHPDLVQFTKTKWNRQEVKEHAGVECSVVGPSVNVDLYRPRRRRDPDWPQRPLRIAAMIRPSSPRRSARLTMEVLRETQRAHGDTIEIVLFGTESSDPEFLALPHDFAWRNAGMLTQPQVAFLLNEVDVFADFSEFQAMGLTAMEAMACGAAVIVPRKGGAGSFAVHEQNALFVDTSSQRACLDTLERLINDERLRAGLQQQAIVDVCQHHPERAAYNILSVLFPAASRPMR